jgi:hypothetical protein
LKPRCPEAGEKKDTIVSTPIQKKKYDDVQLLFIDRWTRCHTVNTILKQDKTREEWLETVLRMREKAPDLFLDEDITALADFLTERVGKIVLLICAYWPDRNFTKIGLAVRNLGLSLICL